MSQSTPRKFIRLEVQDGHLYVDPASITGMKVHKGHDNWTEIWTTTATKITVLHRPEEIEALINERSNKIQETI